MTCGICLPTQRSLLRNVTVHFPSDFLIADKFDNAANTKVVTVAEGKGMMVVSFLNTKPVMFVFAFVIIVCCLLIAIGVSATILIMIQSTHN